MPNNIAFNIMNIKIKNMLIINNKKQVNKMGVRDSYQTHEGNSLYLQNNGGPLHQTPLESDAS